MRFLLKKMTEKLAQAPGTLTHIGERRVEAVTISELRYNQQTVEEREIDLSEGYSPGDDFKGVIWLNVIGIHDTSIIETLGGAFGIHSLVQEDILNTFQRPKIEEFDIVGADEQEITGDLS